MNRIVDRGGGVWQVKVPLPFPLQWVNAYVVLSKDGVDVIDPGLHTPEAEARWAEAAETIPFDWRGVRSIVLTHHHPDHYGLAGWMQEKTDAPVKLSAPALDQARRLWGATASADTAADTLALFLRHGFPEAESPAMRAHLDSFVALVSPQPTRFVTIASGDRIRLGDAEYEAIHTPGHAEGHLSFLCADTGRLFCGDHVLPGITPNVSLLPFGDPDPLRTFLTSLATAGERRVAEAFPGHREPFSHYAERAAAIAAHHEERLRRMESLLAAPTTAYDVCRALFGDKLSVHQLRFALAETLAHLVYLESEGRARSEDGPPVRFAAR